MMRISLLTLLLLSLFSFSAFAQFVDIGADLTGAGDASISWGDYDGDNDLDLLIAGQTSNGIATTLYRNDNGSFVEVENTPFTGISLGEVAFGDYDGDGDPDVLLTGQKADGVATTQLYHNEVGTFIDANAGITALKASMVDWGDYDNDGDLDFAIAGVGTDDVTVSKIFQNNNGSFTDIGAGIRGLRRGDLQWFDYDGDNDLDLTISGRDTSNDRWTILYKNTNGQFADSGFEFPDVDLSGLAWGGHAGGNNEDLFIAGTSDASIIARVYDNPTQIVGTDGNPRLAASFDGVEFAAAAFGDANNDEGLEIAFMGRTAGGQAVTRIFEWSSNDYTDSGASIVGLYKGSLEWGDYDADGDLDLAIVGFNNSDVGVARVYQNTTDSGNSTPDPPFNLWVEQNGSFTEFNWGLGLDAGTDPLDLTYDLRVGTSPGGSDVVSPASSGEGDQGNSLAFTLDNLADGTYYWSVRSVDPQFARSAYAFEQVFSIGDDRFANVGGGLPANAGKVRWGDVNGDGRQDILLTGTIDKSSALSEIYLNNGGSFSNINAGLAQVHQGTTELSDFDNDGDLDILLYGDDEDEFNEEGFVARLYRNNTGLFEDLNVSFPAIHEFSDYDFESVKFGDVDNDGDQDLIAPSSSGNIRIFENLGGSFSGSSESWGSNLSDGPLTVADYDSDGDLDFFVTGLDTEVFKGAISNVYENTGSTFSRLSLGIRGFWFGVPAWGDFDNDGDPDLAHTGSPFVTDDPGVRGEFAIVYRNDGDGFTPVSELLARGGGQAIWGDYDVDGDLDLLLVDKTGSPLYENRNGTFVNIAGAFDEAEVEFADFGDYDGDDDLDVIISGKDANGNNITRVYSNTRGLKNDEPLAPTGLSIALEGPGAVTFSWDATTDEETSSGGLSYNLRIGTSPGAGDVMTAASLENGVTLVPRMGNVNQNTSWTVNSLDDGKYFWSVQAVDAGFMGSPFAEEQILNLPDPTIPVELTTFTAISQAEGVALAWETASEINNAGFEIERAVDGSAFAKIAFVEGHGTTTEPQAYSFEDADLPFEAESIGYRLKQIDFDGRFEYSEEVAVQRNLPSAVSLLPNYPNPFNPSTEIRYALPVDADVRLVVYDIAGREIAVLVDSFQEAGRHEVVFDGNRLASGVYVYILQTPATVQKRQMVLLK